MRVFPFSGLRLGGGSENICSNRRTVRDVSPKQAQTPPAGLNARELHGIDDLGKGGFAQMGKPAPEWAIFFKI